MKKFKHLSIILMASALGLSSCSFSDFLNIFTGKSVVSVDIQDVNKRIYESSDPFKLEVKVEVKGSAEKTVTWKSSDEKLASVDSKGVLTPKKAGKVEISATSTVDSKKSDKLEINIYEAGPRSYLIDEGYDYSPTFPTKELKEFGGVDFIAMETAEGFYFNEIPDADDYYHTFYVYYERTNDNKQALNDFVINNNLFCYHDEYIGIDCFIEPSQKVQADIDYQYVSYMVEETEVDDEDVLNYLAFHEADDMFSDATETTDTDWNSQLKEALTELGADDLPFVKLGADYDYDGDGYVMIYDYSKDYTKLANYSDAFNGTLYSKEYSDEYEDYVYKKHLDTYTDVIVYPFFCNYGNVIYVVRVARDLDFYPGDALNSFISNTLKSIIELPVFNTSCENPNYNFVTFKDDDGFNGAIKISGCTEAECLTYVGQLQAMGFVMDTLHAINHENGESYVKLQYGKVIVEANINFTRKSNASEISAMLEIIAEFNSLTDAQIEALTEEEFYRYQAAFDDYYDYLDYGYFTIYNDYSAVNYASIIVYLDSELANKEAGVYLKEATCKLLTGASHQIQPYLVEIFPAVSVSYSSDKPEIASVDSNGKVSAISEGTATITITAGEYQTTLEITVEEAHSYED